MTNDEPTLKPFSDDDDQGTDTAFGAPTPQPQERSTFAREMPRRSVDTKAEGPKFAGIHGLMPPPGIKRHQAGDIVGLDGPELGLVGEGQNPEAIVPVTEHQTRLGPLNDQEDLPEDVTASGVRDLPEEAEATPATPPAPVVPTPAVTPVAPVAPPPTPTPVVPQPLPGTEDHGPGEDRTAVTKPAATQGVTDATKALRDLEAPKRPDNNWAQRLALAALAFTKFGPIANQVIHPKWSQEQAGYLATQADLEKRQKEEETAASTDALVAQREAAAKQKEALAADYENKRKEQERAIEDRIKAQTSERNRKFLADRLKGREADSVYQAQGAPMPPGYEYITDPEKPGFGFATPPAWRPAPSALLPFLPGAKENDPISHSEFVNATKAMQQMQLEGAKQAGKPDPASASKQGFQATLSKLAAAGELPPQANSDVNALQRAINSSSQITSEEKAQALGYIATNPTPASTTTAGVQRMNVMVGGRELPVINKESGELEYRNPDEINRNPGLYAPAGPGAQAKSKRAIFDDLHYNIGTARKAVQALGTMDAGTRAQLALALGDTDPHSALQTWMRGEIGQTMTPQQQEAVQALAQLTENAMSIRSLAGMGQGAQDMRDAIRHTIPNGKSPSVPYMQQQLDKFEQVVSRLEKGVPGMNAPSHGKTDISKAKFTVVDPNGKAHPFETKAQADEFQRQLNSARQ